MCMKKLLIFVTLFYFLLCKIVLATDLSQWHILEVKAVYVDYMNMKYSQEPFLAPTYHAKDRLDLHLDIELVDHILFVDNMIHSETDESQYRLVGWNYRAGVHVGNSIDLFIEHFSQHLLDYVPNSTNSYDAIGFRLYFYRR